MEIVRKAALAIACLAMLAQSTAQERDSSRELWDELEMLRLRVQFRRGVAKGESNP